MIRLLFALAVVVVLSAGIAWVADRPGSVAIEFDNHRLDTSVAALAMVGAGLMVLSAVLMLVWRWATQGIWEERKLARHRRGYNELAWGLSALMEGDGKRAERHAKKFESLVGETALSDVLAGQAALAQGDVATARQRFRALEGDRRTRALALHGLFAVDTTEGDRPAMLATAKRAIEQNPRADWAQAGLFDNAVALGDWTAADTALLASLKSGRITEVVFRRRRAVIRLAEARKARAEGHPEAALKLSREASKLDPALVPARLLTAEGYKAKSAIRRARAVIREGWRAAPHPDLAAAWLTLAEPSQPAALYKYVQTLVDERESVDGHLALSRQAMIADLPGPARDHLAAAAALAPQRRVYRALEALEQAQGNEGSARIAAAKAESAPRDPTWHCGQCGHRQSVWSELCGGCGAFGTLDWTPDDRGALLTAG
ncbi:heme biosynthesis HemY N-terminal domain-containing protein [Iodidimonas sp. SYSU 1G8]|uniref:heme biosynthesis protein HemY n=1 Tax=Iodidimonas sp. SYSU 1G8 TaxID=3133967 RepID=UPI0031FE6280